MPRLSVSRTTSGRMTGKVGAAGANGRKGVVERVGDHFLERSAAAVADTRRDALGRLAGAQRCEQQEVCHFRPPPGS